MRLSLVLFLLPITKAFIAVQIHQDSLYQPQSSCAFMWNTTLSNDPSIQSCIWECVHEKNCQTAVYYTNERICSMFTELCELGQIQSAGNVQSSVICYRKNHNPISTCPLSTTIDHEETTTDQEETTTDRKETTTSKMKISTELPDLIQLTDMNETVFGIWNTTAGRDSITAESGNKRGGYPPSECPQNVFDRNSRTKYVNWGAYTPSENNIQAGIDTGFYVTLNRGSSLLRAIQFRTANDVSDRDPLTMTIEGSNQTSSALNSGSSWSLIYNGSTGIENITARFSIGQKIQFSSNSIWYSSYRLLITSKRGVSGGVQYSEVEFFGW